MQNLFSIFDQTSRIFGVSFNWLRACLAVMWVPSYFWVCNSQLTATLKSLINYLNREFKLNFAPVISPGHTHWAIRMFIFIFINNFMGLTPYTFTRSSHLSFSLSLGLSCWLGYFIYSFVRDTAHSLAHFVPLGTPYILIPFIVLIEIIRSLIRPLTLSVRLAANIVAGHLLITLISAPIAGLSVSLGVFALVGLATLIILETAVALIQAYVFRMLRTLYLREVNYSSLNYL